MLFFYIDETGNRDPQTQVTREDGSVLQKDWLYVLTAVSLFEHRWHGFEKTLNRHKAGLMTRLHKDHGLNLELADTEVKSNWIRIPKECARHPFLSRLNESELLGLVDLFYQQLAYHNMYIFSVLVDKRYLPSYMDQTKLHRKSWELLLELIEQFMRNTHWRHQAIMVNDDVSRQANRALAMKHAYILDQGTTNGVWLKHVCEMPMFVRSELSSGVQLADLCSYNIYRAFRSGDLTYPFFARIASRVWSRCNTAKSPFSGLYVFPGSSPLRELVDQFEDERARTSESPGPS